MSPFGWGVAATVFFTCLLLAGGAQIKRQINLPPEISQHCIDTFFGLLSSPDGGACLTRLGESVGIENGTIVIELTVDQLEFTCGSTGCQLAFVSLIGACEVCHAVMNEYTVLPDCNIIRVPSGDICLALFVLLSQQTMTLQTHYSSNGPAIAGH